MNLERKCRIQQKRIDNLNERIRQLEDKNNILLKENQELRDRAQAQSNMINEVENVQSEYYKGLEEIKNLKEKCRESIRDARNVQKEYEKKFEKTVKDFKKET